MDNRAYLLKSLKWVNASCPLCLSSNTHSIDLANYLSRKRLGQFGFDVHPVMCIKCGMIYLGYRWDADTYSRFYKYVYNQFYRIDLFPDIGQNGLKARYNSIYHFLQAAVPNFRPSAVVDYGGGSGIGACEVAKRFALDNAVLIDPATESAPDHFDSISIKRYDCITELKQHVRKIIIMRHVIEHFVDLRTELQALYNSLGNSDLVYISTPDTERIRLDLYDYSDPLEYFFRVPHTLYFSQKTLSQSLYNSGFAILESSIVDNEIRVLARKETSLTAVTDCNLLNYDPSSLICRQLEMLRRASGQHK